MTLNEFRKITKNYAGDSQLLFFPASIELVDEQGSPVPDTNVLCLFVGTPEDGELLSIGEIQVIEESDVIEA